MRLCLSLFGMISVLLLNACSSSPDPEKSDQTVRKAYEIARLTREDPAGKTYRDAKALLRELLPDVSQENSLTASVLKFAEETLEIQADPEQLQRLHEAVPLNFSGNKIYRVNDANGQAVLAVKVYPQPWGKSSSFLHELSSFDLTSLVLWRRMTPIRLQGLAQCSVDDNTYALAALSYARGRSLQELVSALVQKPNGTLDRFQQLQTAKKAFEIFGRALAELHRKRVGPEVKGAIREALLSDFEGRLDSALQHQNGALNSDRLRDYFQQSVQQLNKQKFTYRYVHGAAQLSKFFFDPTSDTVTMVDLGPLNASVGNRGQPIGFAAQDYLQFTHDLSRMKLLGLTQDEETSLLLAFQIGYFESGGVAPTQAERRFGEFLIRLQTLSLAPEALASLPPSIKRLIILRSEEDRAELQEQLHAFALEGESTP